MHSYYSSYESYNVANVFVGRKGSVATLCEISQIQPKCKLCTTYFVAYNPYTSENETLEPPAEAPVRKKKILGY